MMKQIKNKRCTRNEKGHLVRKSHYEHEHVDADLVRQTWVEEAIPWMKENGVKLAIVDNDSKFHTKMLVEACKAEGIQIYPGGGKKPWDREENGYPHGPTIACPLKLNLQMLSKMLN